LGANRSASASRRCKGRSHGANRDEVSRARTAAMASTTRIGSAHLENRVHRRKRAPITSPRLP
jgi:hypothetical protein